MKHKHCGTVPTVCMRGQHEITKGILILINKIERGAVIERAEGAIIWTVEIDYHQSLTPRIKLRASEQELFFFFPSIQPH